MEVENKRVYNLLSDSLKNAAADGGSREEYTALIGESFAKEKGRLHSAHLKGAGGRDLVENYTTLVDEVVVSAYRAAWERWGSLGETDTKGVALIALGGYGRGELSPFSDVDIMVLHSGDLDSTVETVGRNLFYTLWDLGFDLGNSFHSIDSCLKGARSDPNLKTSLLEARLISGDNNLYQDLIHQLEKVYKSGVKAFIRRKLKDKGERYSRYGASIYIQEPNVKESPGGLRDVHEALWIAKLHHGVMNLQGLVKEGVISSEEKDRLEKGQAFLLRIRNELHFASGRRNDILGMEVQDRVAISLGFKDDSFLNALEHFMRDYYLAAKDIHLISDLIIRESFQGTSRLRAIIEKIFRPKRIRVDDGLVSIKGSLYLESSDLFRLSPETMMEVFAHAGRSGLSLDGKLKDMIRENLGLIGDDFRGNAKVRNTFFEILESRWTERLLGEMHEIGFLGKYLPEFDALTCLVQHDAYHRYTADEHTLIAIGNLFVLGKEEETLLADVYRQIENKRNLILAVLFHDVGKAQGSPHEEKSLLLASQAMRRLGLAREDMEIVEFLVANHLTMSYISQQRDLGDSKVIKEFASEVGDRERLNMLYLLTYADISAVNPDAWNEWRRVLLEELYIKSLKELDLTPEVEVKDSDLAARVHEASGDYTNERVDRHLEDMPPEYLVSTHPERVIEHLRLVDALGGQSAAISYHIATGWVDFVICTSDRTRLFSKISGAMAAKNVNILGADIYTRSDGVVLDTFRVADDQGRSITDEYRLEEIKSTLFGVLSGDVHLPALLARRKKTLAGRRRKTIVPTEVRIDNSASESYTVIDLVTQDRVGLLFSITSLLSGLDLGIQKAKVSTEGQKARDSLYVYGINGGKITDEGELGEIKKMLESVCG